ncbi:Mitochondrial inner membrane magnesium transporter mrs2 [Cytospora mali]|uniref:Magnesium transporter n=1 Tax=Cytospora mali TaxID=578113 RepID=A0A194WDI7_CYTMA|nr:Mitochondrial inner membrane magnesium transporter mrs2 [Valsa mali]
MRSALHPAVPSRRLLRYLRFQSEGIAFFSTNNHGHAAAGAGAATAAVTSVSCCAPSRDPREPNHIVTGDRLSPRRLSTSKPRRSGAAFHSAVLDLESILPKTLKRVRPSGTNLLNPNNIVSARRSASTKEPGKDEEEGRKASWQQRLWGPNTVKPNFRSRTSDDSDTSIFTTSMTARRAKAALEPVLRCTEVDEKGEAILTDGAFKKSELIAKYGLMPRDLRKIDSSNLPHILVRPSAILLNLLHLRVLIKNDRVLLFDVYGSSSSSAQSEFMYELQGKLRQKQAPGSSNDQPYEFRALEVVLMSVTSELWKDFGTVQDPVMHLLSDLEEDVDREKLRILLVLSKKVSTFEQKARLVRDAIDELLDADDDLSEMYLTEKTKDISREIDDHTEIEMLLESYHKICDEVVQEAGNLVSGIRNTEEIIRAILDANRNSLMLLDLKFSVGTLGLAMGTFLAGLYGMNLENFIEETNWGFASVTASSAFFSLLVCWYGLVKLRKVQRVRMGQSSSRTRKSSPAKDGCEPYGAAHWYRDDSPTALLEAKHREKLKRIANMKQRQASTTGFKGWFQRFH